MDDPRVFHSLSIEIQGGKNKLEDIYRSGPSVGFLFINEFMTAIMSIDMEYLRVMLGGAMMHPCLRATLYIYFVIEDVTA